MTTIDPAKHQQLIRDFDGERAAFVTYASVLRRVLQNACAVSFPNAFVQTRAKTTSSFAEKCVRKAEQYKDKNPLQEMTDLCGGRVIVQTLTQVEAARQFIEANFVVLEYDPKSTSLGEERFGYRDMHFVVQLDPVRAVALGVTGEELRLIASKRAEIQVRTWVQHAWADTMHDRIYKAPLRLSSEIRRAGNLLAALMEEGDRSFETLTHELDGMIANYAAIAPRSEVEREIAAQRLILEHEQDTARRPGLALKLGRLLAACGDYAEVEAMLTPYRDVRDGNRGELLQDLGYAVCKLHRGTPRSGTYGIGVDLLEEAGNICAAGQGEFVIDPRRRASLLARALSRMAWAVEPVQGGMPRARELHAQAHEQEPANPYYLAEMLGYEIYSTHQRDISAATRTLLREATKTCRAHAEAGTELPRAYFTAGRLCLLREEPLDALGYYARGVHHCLAGTYCVPDDALAVEREWIEHLHAGVNPPESHRWAMDLIDIAEQLRRAGQETTTAATPHVVMVSGGATSIAPEMLERCEPLLRAVLEGFAGRVVSGGTAVGIPGCVGQLTEKLQESGEQFETIGYIPSRLPHDTPKDTSYDRFLTCGESGFTPDQTLRVWKDLLSEGVAPQEVLCLGFGGGRLSAVDYQLALALGATVAVAEGSGGSADALVSDPLWKDLPNLMALPMDVATFCGLLVPKTDRFDEEALLAMAQATHARYVAISTGQLKENMRPWPELAETYRNANREQACYAVRILEAEGFRVERAADPENPILFEHFRDEEIERMAEIEHGRWNVERLRDGWRYARVRDNERKLHPSIVRWAELSDNVKKYDRESVRGFPAMLAKAGLEVRRA